MTTLSVVVPVIGSLVTLLITLAAVTPRARRLKRIDQELALIKAAPEGPVQDELKAVVLDSIMDLRTRDEVESFGLRAVRLAFVLLISSGALGVVRFLLQALRETETGRTTSWLQAALDIADWAAFSCFVVAVAAAVTGLGYWGGGALYLKVAAWRSSREKRPS